MCSIDLCSACGCPRPMSSDFEQCDRCPTRPIRCPLLVFVRVITAGKFSNSLDIQAKSYTVLGKAEVCSGIQTRQHKRPAYQVNLRGQPVCVCQIATSSHRKRQGEISETRQATTTGFPRICLTDTAPKKR